MAMFFVLILNQQNTYLISEECMSSVFECPGDSLDLNPTQEVSNITEISCSKENLT